ncbi:MAG: hypothetical protein M4579_007272 [Chaenotheca gracillima]|nr:MAG: hypothetical protein M4579_007272 [Chaenotheca gracillima]
MSTPNSQEAVAASSLLRPGDKETLEETKSVRKEIMRNKFHVPWGLYPEEAILGTEFGDANIASAWCDLLPAPDPLGEALRGARSWDDMLVCRQRDVLLSEDDEAAQTLAREMRGRLVAALEETWEAMEEQERNAYGENAFFAKKDMARTSKP